VRYLDHAATTPMHPAAAAAVVAEMAVVGNASSLHASGRRARRIVEESRESIAAALGARPSEVVLTGGGTESDNIALKGLYWARQAEDPRRRRVVVSSVEHHAVLDAAQWLAAEQGAQVVQLPVDSWGRVSPQALDAVLADDPGSTAVVSVMWANNEVGTVQPVEQLAQVAHSHDVPFHTDAVQAVGQLPVSFEASGVDAMTITGHKFGGPYGAGVLFLRRGLACTPLTHGGGQRAPILSRVRGRLAADAARRPRRGVLDRVSLLRRDRPAEPRARRHGMRREPRPRVTAVLPGSHLDGR